MKLIKLIGQKSLAKKGESVFEIRTMKDELSPLGSDHVAWILTIFKKYSLMKLHSFLMNAPFKSSGPGALLSSILLRAISASFGSKAETSELATESSSLFGSKEAKLTFRVLKLGEKIFSK